MTRHGSEASSDASVHAESTTSSPGLSRSSTDPTHRERHNSRIGQAMDHIRQTLSQEQERLFGPHKIAQQHRQYQAKVGEHLEHLREQDKIDRARAEAEMSWENNDTSGASPAVQARKSFDLNENNMGADSEEDRERQKSWGWPGLGTFPETPKDPAKVRRRSGSAERAAELEHKVEEATYEAIDGAAESEAYGWPGIGEFPALKKR
ncbi:hypothetical protein LTR99_002943 [Exophiala xenobiotica]|uniref:Uncharacterized protein n=1 Tax=Vermiconidia calcicola TaxID=1690605 RepID=A0AAV9Q9Z2_9PEZI|nr:hypothetical protein LTR92_005683 [Exophiala xenobiotica]KAK5538612.1 hypothetical protein LTR25_004154 [Vermiconidia calcicola]KAK5547899.1 hypothetical protein LTR23_002148 [Chaetothyriales sp. CCFEE 6169]KAK5268011.1 hypothetical protein LTR96_006556 [Exophiala xenobiotica]KAK5305401.1 hypothetical protein LTR99_002943 [Exophiala xenobiotica]